MRSSFFSFLAGFIDAEGHIGVYNNMARFAIGNYDKNILFKIYQKLNDCGINCKEPLSDHRKWKKNNEDYVYRENYWHFRIDRKAELLKLFKEIKPYLRHKNKVKALNMAVKNIYGRVKLQKKTISR